jgi:hypothetical protein
MKNSPPSDRPTLEARTRVALMLIGCVLAPCAAVAQAPWTVTVTPTMNPLPIGFCAAVRLTVLDSSRADTPRNALAQRVTLADFDMTVSSPDGKSVVGQQIDASHWSVCACQGATAGTAATITASYPARSLKESARIPGASVQATASFKLAARKGDVNAPGCAMSATQSVRAAVAVPPVSPPVTVTPTSAPTQSGPVGQVIPKGTVGARVAPYKPAPVSVTLDVAANGTWYMPAPVMVAFDVSADGSWYVPAPVTATLDISANGSWIEMQRIPADQIQPAPRPR